jgi:hypothetical protein
MHLNNTFAHKKTIASFTYNNQTNNKHDTGALASYATLTLNSIMVMSVTIIYSTFFASNDQHNMFRKSVDYVAELPLCA